VALSDACRSRIEFRIVDDVFDVVNISASDYIVTIDSPLTYHASWIDPVSARRYQLMEAENADALAPWTAARNDIVEFELVPVLTSATYWERVFPKQ